MENKFDVFGYLEFVEKNKLGRVIKLKTDYDQTECVYRQDVYLVEPWRLGLDPGGLKKLWLYILVYSPPQKKELLKLVFE